MNPILEKNLRTLSERDAALARRVRESPAPPDVQVIPSAKGPLTLRIGRSALHSRYDPVGEAERWVRSQSEAIDQAASVVLMGMGMGHHLNALLKVTGAPVTVVEPDLKILRQAMESVDLSGPLARVQFRLGREAAFFDETRSRPPVVLVHPASRALSPGMYDAIKGRISLPRLRPLNILIIHPIAGGSLPIARYCASALGTLGHRVEVMDYGGGAADLYATMDQVSPHPPHRTALRNQLAGLLSDMAWTRIQTVGPDLILALAQAPLTGETLKRIKESGMTLAYWFVEDFRLMEYWSGIVPYTPYFFTLQEGAFFEQLSAFNGVHVHRLPVAAMPGIHRPMAISPSDRDTWGSDLSFVGAGYYNRRRFFQGLMDKDLKIWGSDWPSGTPLERFLQRGGARIATEEAVRIFNASRINLNLHSSTYHEGINPEGDFVNPRTFEIAAAGCFQLVDPRRDLPGFFDMGREMITFQNLGMLREQIAYYLEHPEEAEMVAVAARQRVLSEHTYAARMEEMLGLMIERGYAPPTPSEEGESVASLVDRAGPHTPLGQYLSRFNGRERLTLQEIVREIRSGNSEVSDPEALFLLMHELSGLK